MRRGQWIRSIQKSNINTYSPYENVAIDYLLQVLKDLQQDHHVSFSNVMNLMKLYHDIQVSLVDKWKRVVILKDELSNLLYSCSSFISSSKETDYTDNIELLFMKLVAKSFPHETLDIISGWTKVNLDEKSGHYLFQLLQLCVRGCLEKDWGERSLSVLSELSISTMDDGSNPHSWKTPDTLWDQVIQGTVKICK